MLHELLRYAEVFNEQREAKTAVECARQSVPAEGVEGGEVDAGADVEDVDYLLGVQAPFLHLGGVSWSSRLNQTGLSYSPGLRDDSGGLD